MGHGGHADAFNFGHLGERNMDPSFSDVPSLPYAASSSSSSSLSLLSSSSSSGNNYIEHRVSKLDTLAGIAIKYGVEVSDIKRMNGLTTDLQMFAHKILQIPLPGRHPPSAALSDDPKTSSCIPPARPPRYGTRTSYCGSSDSVYVPGTKKSDKRPVSVAMGLLRGYYGLSPSQREGNEGTEMTVYKTDNILPTGDAPSTPPQTYANGQCEDLNRMYKKFYNEDLLMKADQDLTYDNLAKTNGLHKMELVADTSSTETEKTNESSVRRRAKVEGTDFLPVVTENVFKQEASLTGRGGNGLSLRPKSAGRVSISSDATGANDNLFTISDPNMADVLVVGVGVMKGFGDSSGNGKAGHDLLSKVRRSSSTPSLQDSAMISPLKSVSRSATRGESQSILTSAVSRPLFDAIPRPSNGWRNKAALD